MTERPTTVRIACWNARGFNSAVPYLRYLFTLSDVIAISEHWLHENKLKRLEEISEHFYYCARSSSFASAENYGTKRGQGGVALFWKKTLGGVSQISNFVHDRFCGIRIQTCNNLVINIISVYLPAQGSPESFEACLDDLSEVLKTREFGSKTIICGDTNADMGSLGGKRSLKVPTLRGKIFFDFVSNFNLTSVNLQEGCSGPIQTFVGPTGSSTIDHILVPSDMIPCVIGSSVLGEDILNCSDHYPVTAEVDVGQLLPTTINASPVRMPKWNKVSVEDVKLLYTDVVERKLHGLLTCVKNIDSNQEIDDAIEQLVATLSKASKAIPIASYRPNLKPYWNLELKNLKLQKVAKHRTWISEGKPSDGTSVAWCEYKRSKKEFAKALKRVSKTYENDQMIEAVESCSADKSIFWRHLKKCRGPSGSKVLAVKNKKDEVIYEICDILKIWKEHFSSICTPKNEPSFDQEHFTAVNTRIDELNSMKDDSPFLEYNFDEAEVQKAVKKLKINKACGYDHISAEHIKYGGPLLITIITMIFNCINKLEYVPNNFRRGIQIPLFKGKNLCSTDTNNYRGITLLSTLSKIYELIIWERLEPWWKKEEVISRLQGACRKGQSCIHTSLLLQETVSSVLEKNNKVFVSYFDVSKAFDTVWINGLFFKLHEMGIRGKLWRLMYRTYADFCCRVRVASSFSEWYPMSCGIHQGGILSLTKYLVFINELLEELEKSNLCCSIMSIRSSPASYADDLATATISKFHTDKVHTMVNNYGNRWRFRFNASKSAVMVFGEEKKQYNINKEHRVFRLGQERVKEKETYDHVGVKICLFDDNTTRVEEKISKGRKTLNASTGLGIRKNGLNMGTCNIIFWQVVVPTVTFGSEVWVSSEKDDELLLAFQRYAGRRVQRFPQRSPNSSSFFGLGWIKLPSYIQVKKLLFILSILKMEPQNTVKKIFELRLTQFSCDMIKSRENRFRSPVFDILNIAIKFGLYEAIKDMTLQKIPLPSKKRWSTLVWQRAWNLEDINWRASNMIHQDNDLLALTIGDSRYLSWWHCVTLIIG